MSDWSEFLALIAAETDQASADRIGEKARDLMGGVRIQIPKRRELTTADAHRLVREHGGDVRKAAKAAGVHATSLYRRLRKPADPGPQLPGTRRLVR